MARLARTAAALVVGVLGTAAPAASGRGDCADYRAVDRLVSVRGISFRAVRPHTSPPVSRALIRAAARSARLTDEFFYRASLVDLSGDMRPELLFRPESALLCGTGGCTTYVFRVSGGRLTPAGEIPVTRTPLIVAPQRTRGWNDLIVKVSGGGAPLDYGVVKFNGRQFVGNPSVARLASRSRVSGLAVLRNARACSLDDEARFRP
jgi:hypothetical protein